MWVKSDTDGKTYWVDDSNYFATARLSEYFGNPLSTPFRLPQHVSEKVEIEKLPHKHLPELDPLEPIIGSCFVNGRVTRCQIVLGYREIYVKRQRIEFLKAIAQEVQSMHKSSSTWDHSDLERSVAPGGGEPRPQKKRRSFPNGKNSKKIAPQPKKTTQAQPKRPRHDENTKKNRRTSSSFSIVPPTRDKCEIEQEVSEPPSDFFVVKQIEAARQTAINAGKPIVRQLSLGSHYMVLSQSGHQLDSEWLQLSASTDQEDDVKWQMTRRMRKPLEPWMDPGLNYASQKMFRSLSLFFCILTLTFRNPFGIQPCYRNRVPMVHVYRSRMVLFSFSTIFIWMVLGFMTINALDLMYRTEEDDSYQTMEYEELQIYYIPVLAVFINVFLAAFWSMLVLLHYCLVMANYYNLWSKAMPFLDMNPSFALGSYIRVHVFCYLVYVTVVAVSFALDWPVVTRGTFGQLFILICRQMWPQVRLLPEAYFFWGQLACCIVYLYCVWVNRTIFMHMHSFSLILRNASYQWNLNFAIRFQLIVTYYRAHLLRIATQGNMIRLYNQHRLIVGLCNYYGKVFLHPLCIYMVTNMGVVTVIMIYFIRYEEKDPKEFNYDYKIQFPDNITDAVIYYTLPKQHEVTTVFVVLVQCLVDFIQGTLGISWGSQAVQESFEFVRRHGLIQCNTRHERRMIHSLYMSFSDPNSPLITADSYFGMTKAKIFSGIMVMAFFWTMIIQCQVEAPSALIEWVPNSSETCIGLPAYEDDLGRFYCMKGHKMRMKVKNRTRRNRFSEILKQKISYDPNLNFWFFENCYDPIFTAAQSKVLQADFGMCRVTFTGVPEELGDLKKQYPRFLNEPMYNQFKLKWSQNAEDWTAPTMLHTDSIYPCDVSTELKWKVFYRDFFVTCRSVLHNRDFVYPVLFYRGSEQDHGKAKHYFVDTNGNNRDCGVNPFAGDDIKDLVACDGSDLRFDDCGSPNTPDFTFDMGGRIGRLKKPTLKYETLEIPDLPEAYADAGFFSTTSIRCWRTLTAIEKCTNKEFRQYCRLALIHTPITDNNKPLYGYLFGKFCYDFLYFVEFQQPNFYQFCRHPRPADIKRRNQWIPEWMINTTIILWGSKEKFYQNIQRIRMRRNAPLLLNLTKKSRQRSKSRSKVYLSRAIRSSKKYHMPSVRELLDLQYSTSNETTMTSRQILLFKFFPCKKNVELVQGWLPIPNVVYMNDDVRVEKFLPDMQQLMKDKTNCWDWPYSRAMIEKDFSNIIAIKDPLGNNFLDDCFNAWFKHYVDSETFIPDLVFSVPTGKLQTIEGYKCWDFIDPIECQAAIKAKNCTLLEHDAINL